MKVDILKSNQAFDNIHKKSTNQADDVQSIKILLQALRSRPLIRQSRSARWHKTEDDKENEKEKEVSNENLEDEKKIKHSFKTRIHGDNNGKMIISQVPIRSDKTVFNEVDNGNADEKYESGNQFLFDWYFGIIERAKFRRLESWYCNIIKNYFI